MGTREIRYCDISGAENGVETHELNIDQMHIEIDLGAGEHHKLLELLQPYIRAGRVGTSDRGLTGPRSRNPSRAPTLTTAEREQLREWAQDKGIQVPANNRFKNSLIEQWRSETSPE